MLNQKLIISQQSRWLIAIMTISDGFTIRQTRQLPRASDCKGASMDPKYFFKFWTNIGISQKLENQFSRLRIKINNFHVFLTFLGKYFDTLTV